ncbi:MAG: alpha/beta hydrolase [Sphingobacteriales bacterium]|nr:MAG: alpha/beta hydrolase [Sphingobacteriales bacterium]
MNPIAPNLVKRNNINIIGNPDADKTIMFGHGFGIDQNSFSEVVKAFEKDYRIILFDNVGGGKSDPAAYSPNRYNTLNGYVADLTDILRSMDAKDIIYVGHSVNGMIGLMVAVKHPEWFSKLIMLGASPRYLNDPGQGYIGGFDQADLDGLYGAMHANYHAWASGFSAVAMQNQDRPELAASFAGTLSEIRPDIALAVAKAIFESDCRQELGKIKIPVLVVQTSDDIAVPDPVAPYMQRHIPNAKLVKVHTKGHFPHMSAPDEVVSAIKSFI